MANNLYGLMTIEKRFRIGEPPSREWIWYGLYVATIALLAWWWK